ncbi:MAG: cobyrinic acid a,c-diamide synthase, partial [Lachnospiraceae bacterium]
MNTPRVMITSPASGSGKTTITCGILQALKNRGKSPVSGKCGPDYIDPMFHEAVLKIPSENLDLFFCQEEVVKTLLKNHAKQGDITILEGAMGYYDGQALNSWKGSAYDVAKVTDTPVILVIPCKGMALSLVPVIQGMLSFRKDH